MSFSVIKILIYNYMKKLTQELFIEKCNEKHKNFYDYSLVIYKNSKSKIKIICPIHGEFEQISIDHKNGRGCSKCAINKNTNNKRNILSYLYERGYKLFNSQYEYNHIKNYKNMHDKIQVKCKYHDFFYTTWHYHLNKKRGCPKCALEKRTDTKTNFIIKSIKIHGQKYNYINVDYVNSRTKVTIICPIHGEFEQRPRDHINSKQGCPICKESKGEKEIRQYLEKHNVEYEYQKTFEKCKDVYVLPFDFYLPSYNICIEYDGEQHFKIVEYWGGKNGLLIRQKRDDIKDKFCFDNNINLLRIRYDEDILKKIKEYGIR